MIFAFISFYALHQILKGCDPMSRCDFRMPRRDSARKNAHLEECHRHQRIFCVSLYIIHFGHQSSGIQFLNDD